MIMVPNQLVGAQESSAVTLECHSEAFPKSINYWTKDNDEIIANSKSHFIFSLKNELIFNESNGFIIKTIGQLP